MRIKNELIKIEDRITESLLIERLKKEWQKIEEREKREKILNKVKTGSKKVAKYLLAAAAISGVLVLAAVSPNIFAAFGRAGLNRRFYKKDDVKKSLRNLKNCNLINILKEENGKIYFEINNKNAKKKILNFCLDEMKLIKSEVWDGVWRIVSFDIPKKLSPARDALRGRLKQLGFYQFHMSIFVCPFECDDEINFLKEIYNLHRYVKLIKATYIDDDEDLKKRFGFR